MWRCFVSLLKYCVWRLMFYHRTVSRGFTIETSINPFSRRQRLLSKSRQSLFSFDGISDKKHDSYVIDSKVQSQQQSYTVTVIYQNRTCQIQVEHHETILSALERQLMSTLRKNLDINELPSECRRGNCMTCAARFVHIDETKSGESTQNDKQRWTLDDSPITTTQKGSQLVRNEDGLTPYVSKMLRNSKFFLTCSSQVQDHGLIIEIGQNHHLWNLVYQKRFDSEKTKVAAFSSMARAIRKTSEKSLERWLHRTEQMLLFSEYDESIYTSDENL